MGRGVPIAVVMKAIDHGLVPGDEMKITGGPGYKGYYAVETIGVNVMVLRRLRWYEWAWRELKRFVKRATLRVKSWAPYY